MKRVSLLFLLCTLGVWAPVLAYKEAIIGTPTRREWNDVWCGFEIEKDHYTLENRGPGCVVAIRRNYLIINSEGKIKRDSIVRIWSQSDVGGWGFNAVFVSFNEGKRIHTISFGTDHASKFSALWNMLNLWLYAGEE